jgi:hypothetical protein
VNQANAAIPKAVTWKENENDADYRPAASDSTAKLQLTAGKPAQQATPAEPATQETSVQPATQLTASLTTSVPTDSSAQTGIWVPGFGWVQTSGDNAVVYTEDNENGNKIGSMG